MLRPRKERYRIGPYEVIGPLGAGGMGEVYRARDPRLNREVALKVLPPEVARDAVRRRRFLEEARAAGGLNHPNILAVYDVSVGTGTPFIVSELLDGSQLRDEIDRGPLPTGRLLDFAVQMASGLSAAHDAGIVHCDLKPENVMVTRDGRVKIVDFGLATYAAVTGQATEPTTVTILGTIVGTPHYMSPEQARGGGLDFRSDQFSLGLILYEMATGVQPFRRDTAVQTMSAIVDDEPRPIAELNPKTPAVLRWMIERCLAKNPGDRYTSTADLAKDLTTLQRRLAEVSGLDAHPVHAPALARKRIALASGVGLVLLAAAAAAVVPSGGIDMSASRYTPLVTDARFQGAPAWSPDGNTLAYVSTVDGILQVFSRSEASSGSHQLTRSRFDAHNPFWSPDGTRIYFHRLALDRESLWSISAAGGPEELVLENAIEAAISPDGRTLAFFREADTDQTLLGSSQSIWLASPTGTDDRRYMEAPFDRRMFVAGALRFSPDGSKLLAWVWGWEDASTVPSPEFWVLPFPEGRPYRVLHELARSASAAPSFDWLPDGRRIVVSLWDAATTGMHLWIADIETGASTQLTSTYVSENRPAVAPDGQRIAFTSEAIDFDLVEIPLDGSAVRNLLATSRNELDPTFSQDGSQYAYVSDKDGVLQIWHSSRDRRFERLVVSGNQFPGDTTLAFGAPALSPDGQRIAYQRYGERTGYQIWVSTLAAAGPPVRLTAASLYQDAPAWSPDGAWIAFIERTTDKMSVLSKARVGVNEPREIILRDIPLLAARPKWSPDGRWILCDTADGLVIVSPTANQEPRVISQELWIAYTWSADSKHVYGLRESDHRHRHFALARIAIDTLEEDLINPDVGLIPPASQPIRGLEVTGPNALATSIASARSEIWVIEGLNLRRRTVLDRLWRAP
jgi:eukaryotic-like serine/threonine-protein kinase